MSKTSSAKKTILLNKICRESIYERHTQGVGTCAIPPPFIAERGRSNGSDRHCLPIWILILNYDSSIVFEQSPQFLSLRVSKPCRSPPISTPRPSRQIGHSHFQGHHTSLGLTTEFSPRLWVFARHPLAMAPGLS